jgi:hypothetical protein
LITAHFVQIALPMQLAARGANGFLRLEPYKKLERGLDRFPLGLVTG